MHNNNMYRTHHLVTAPPHTTQFIKISQTVNLISRIIHTKWFKKSSQIITQLNHSTNRKHSSVAFQRCKRLTDTSSTTQFTQKAVLSLLFLPSETYLRLARPSKNYPRSVKISSPRKPTITGPRPTKPHSPNETAITKLYSARTRPVQARDFSPKLIPNHTIITNNKI